MKNYILGKLKLIKEYFNPNRTLGVTLLFFEIALLSIINLLISGNILPALDISNYQFNDYVLSFVNPYKYLTFIKYGLFVFIIAISALGVYYLFKDNHLTQKLVLRNKVIPFYIVFCIITLYINTGNLIKILLLFLIFIFFTASCFKFKINIFKFSEKTKSIAFSVVLSIVIIQFIHIFYPFVFQNIKLINEFYDIPEITIINTLKDSKEIDNTDFINKYNINGVQNKYDIRKQRTYVPSIPYKNSQKIQKLLDTQSYYVNLYNLPDKTENTAYNYLYYKDGRLNIIGQLSNYQKDYLKIHANSQAEKLDTEKVYNEIANKLDDINIFRMTKKPIKENYQLTEYNKFIKNNNFEIHWQILNRYYIHHQNHLIAPINELLLGKSADNIFFQYGKTNTIILSKIINKLGGFDFSKYMKVTYSFYYIYFAIFLIMVFLFFKRKDYILSWLFLTVGSLNYTTDEFLRIAPGINPIRHFFDIFVLLFVYLYFYKKMKITLILAVFSSFIAILNESMTGLFIFLSVIATLFIKNFIFDKKNIFEIIVLFTSLPIAYFVKQIGQSNIDYATNYFLAGLLGFPTSKTTILTVIILISLGYVVLLKKFLNKDQDNYPVTYFYAALFFYVQALLFYYMWGSDFNHLLVYFPFFAFAILAYLFNSDLKIKYPNIHTKIISCVLIFSTLFYCVSIYKYYINLYSFNKIFKTHKIYEWTLPHTNFISTMNPVYFEDSVKLIQKYSKDKGIYIISKYDSFIPVISEKYSNMPYIEVSNFLTSKKEIENNIKVLKTNKPDYLFVDRDIDRDYAQDILFNEYEFRYLFYESMWRFERLSLMKDIFNAVRKDYEPVESSYLLTVWKRKQQ